MTTYAIKAPDGNTYQIDGPEGASQTDVQNEVLKQHPTAAKTTPDPADTHYTPPETPGIGRQLLDVGKDAAGTVARGAGDVVGAISNVAHIPRLGGDGNYEDPTETGAEWHKPFEHPDDTEPTIHAAMGLASHVAPAIPVIGKAAGDIAKKGQDALENGGPGARFVGDITKPVGEIGAAVGTVMGAKDVAGMAGDAADTAVNALNKPTAAQASTLASNQQIVRARADGFKLTANDMRAANPSASDSGIHGATTSDPVSTDRIQRNNSARATQTMADDAKLPNNRAVNPDEIQARLDQEGQVYQQVAQSVGNGRTPTPKLASDLNSAAPHAATQEATDANSALVKHYGDRYATQFNGPDALEDIKALRDEATTRMSSTDATEKSKGRTQLSIANALEDEMMRQLPASAQDLKTAFPDARMQYAKLNELRSVTEGGQVNPVKVLELKRAGAPLTGAADAVANAADVAPESMSRAGGAPTTQLAAPTHTGMIRNVTHAVTGLTRKIIPGINPATDAYQEAHYGPVGGSDATAPASSAPTVSPVRSVALSQPEGNAGRLSTGSQQNLPEAPGMRGTQRPAPFELAHPEGTPVEPYQHEIHAPDVPLKNQPPRPGMDLVPPPGVQNADLEPSPPEQHGFAFEPHQKEISVNVPKPPAKMSSADRAKWEAAALQRIRDQS